LEDGYKFSENFCTGRNTSRYPRY